ncbi:HTH-type transcriptional activator mta [bioreactor metagenome]|uniref:HTH-type transcriptional activator mta n=1 Tax=bioreactor metagenome TaxID=1076179 RepID=A0A644YMN2_9ZZZZ
MEYKIQELADLAGISSRTLRYYDKIGLLKPGRIHSNGYRVYGGAEVDLLQQILLYREMDVPLEEISKILHAPNFDRKVALQNHLRALSDHRDRLNLLIETVQKTISAEKGGILMKDHAKFEGMKKNMIEENEKKYGKETRAHFGDKVVNESNAKLMGLTQKQFEDHETLTTLLNQTLVRALEEGDPGSQLAQKACELHKQWLGSFWSEYSKEAHLGLVQMYVDDSRFKAYYDAIAPGTAEFLLEAMKRYCQ